MIAVREMNVLALINEEAMFPRVSFNYYYQFIVQLQPQFCLQGTDRTMLNKLCRQHGKNPSFESPKAQHDETFGIKHFAGSVRYNTKGGVLF